MAKSKSDSSSQKGKSQVYNPQNDKWIKRDSEGRFQDVKSDGTAFKDLKKEK